MPLALNDLHKKFVTANARENARHKPALPENPVMWATSFAPCADNGLAGKYLCEQFGRQLKREDQLAALARDLQRRATDSNGNPPCINEVFSHGVPRFAPFLDFDGASVHFAHVNTAWLKRYAELVLQTVREVAPARPAGEGGPRNVLQVVITTTVTEPLGEFRPVDADIYACPHCPASEAVPRSANAQVYLCRECNASWTRADAGDGSENSSGDESEPEEDARGESDLQFTFRSASRRAPHQQLLPVRRRTRRVGAHFRVQGILVTPADALEFVRLVRQRSYAFDRSIPVSAWDDALDEGPVARRQLRLTLTHKAAKCPTCKGRRVANIECFACFGRGFEVLENKAYHVLDVLCDAPCDAVAVMTGEQLCEDAGPARPQFLTDVDLDGAGAVARERVRTDCAFVLTLCSIGVPIEAAVETDFEFSAVFGGAPASLAAAGTGPHPLLPVQDGAASGRKRRFEDTLRAAAAPVVTPVPSTGACAQHQKLLRGAKNFLPPEKFASLLDAVVEACPTYADASVRQAFFMDKTHRVIVAHLDGPSSTFCLNKARNAGGSTQDGFHRSSRAWATITQSGTGVCFVRLRCFSKKRATHPDTGEECGCGSWRGEVFTLSHAIATLIFGADATSTGAKSVRPARARPQQARVQTSGGGGGGGTHNDLGDAGEGAHEAVDDRVCVAQQSVYPFLAGFRRNGSLVKFLRDVENSSNTGNFCSFVDKLPADPMANVMKCLDRAGVRVCTSPRHSRNGRTSMLGVIRRAHAARAQRTQLCPAWE